MSFSNSSVLIYDNSANITASFETNQSTPYSVVLGPSFNGVTLDAVVSRAGYSKNQSQFTGGGAVSFSSTPTLDEDPDGTPAYTGTTDANITINFTFTPTLRMFIDIGDASVSSQTAYDMVEDAFETEDGCRFLVESGGARVSQAVLAGQTYFLLGQNIRLRRRAPGDVNAAIDAYVISQDGIPLDGTNGGVQFLVAQDINEIWNALTANYNTANTFGALLNNFLDAAVSTRLASSGYVAPDNASIGDILADTNELQTNQGDWATATGFSTFDPALDTVARVTLVDTTTTNTDMRGTDDANTVVPDNAGIQADIAALNDFDPALDTVARVALVDVTTLNSDMVGTDGAVTSLAGIATTADVNASEASVITEVDGVKVKTDQLTFTVPGKVDSNVHYVDDDEVTGSGTELDPWGPV